MHSLCLVRPPNALIAPSPPPHFPGWTLIIYFMSFTFGAAVYKFVEMPAKAFFAAKPKTETKPKEA